MAAVERIREERPNTLITPGLIYKHLDVKPNCGVCLCHICELVHHAEAPSPPRLADHVRRPSGRTNSRPAKQESSG